MHRYPTRFQALKQTLSLDDQIKRDLRVINDLLVKCNAAESRRDHTEICVKVFQYLCIHPLLIHVHNGFRNAITQKIKQLEQDIRVVRHSYMMEALEMHRLPSNATQREKNKISELFIVLEELFQRIKPLL